jgi:hypothetical protein
MAYANSYGLGAEYFSKSLGPWPLRTLATTVKVDRCSSKLRICMTSQMGFCEKRETSDTARRRKAVPHLFTNDLQVQIADYAVKHSTQGSGVTQCLGTASGRVN